jgi:adenosine deaminase
MDMCRKDNLDIKRFPYDNPDEFRKRVTLEGPQQSLVDFLKPFTEVNFILSSPDNLRRQCIEFCEDQKKHNVIYTESRICPFLYIGRDLFTPEGVVQTVLDAFKEGEALYDIKIRLILCFLRPCPEWSPEIARLAIKYKDQGVVGIDIAGDELAPIDGHLESFKVTSQCIYYSNNSHNTTRTLCSRTKSRKFTFNLCPIFRFHLFST